MPEPSQQSDQMILKVDGKPHYGWKQATLKRDLNEAAHSFSFVMTDRWANSEPFAIKANSSAVCMINNTIISSGFIERVNVEYDSDSHSITAEGRSKVADVIDSSTLGKQFKNQTFFSIASALCKPYGINVINVAGTQEKIVNQAIDPGEPVYEFLERMARYVGVLLVSDKNGDLLITNASRKHCDTALELGINIKACDMNIDVSQRFSEYVVVGQHPASDDAWTTESLIKNSGKALDKRIARHRAMVFSNDDAANIKQCTQRAQWHMNTHYGRSKTINYTVSGWRQSSGEFWAPNLLVRVIDHVLGINADWLISAVEFVQTETSKYTRITVQPPEAYLPQDLPEPKTKSGGGKKGKGKRKGSSDDALLKYIKEAKDKGLL